tara:strand:- start:1396 stop:2181 length:786 start_codon:yes stop_codon:yes gene_type:complete
MLKNPELIVNLPTYNSIHNLEKIFDALFKSELKIKKVFITDNNSNIPDLKKIELVNNLKSKFFDNIILIINKENYGIGGSQKITFDYLKNENFDYFINLQTSNRYDPKIAINDIIKNIISQKDYYLFSRFLIKENTKNYNLVRKFANKFFIFLTKILTKANLSDPGNAQYIIKKSFFDKIDLNEVKKITNSSHFPHFLNVKLYNMKIDFKEIPINWGEGNIKSHLNSITYPIILLFSLIKYFFTKSFFLEKYNNFKHRKIV